MRQARWRQPLAVIDQLFEHPYRFDFFQAVSLLERWLSVQGAPAAHEGRGGGLPAQIRFRNPVSLAFAPSEIAMLSVRYRLAETAEQPPVASPMDSAKPKSPSQRLDDIEHIELTPAFMGLLGVNGALPMFYTEQLLQRELYQKEKDKAARAFFDLFQHRAVTLFYQAWRKHRLPLRFEQDRRQHFLPMVLALAGVGQDALRGRLGAEAGGVADDALAFYAGALHQRPVSVATMARVLSHYFRVPVKLEQFVGRWFALGLQSQTSLGLAQATLGQGALVGERVWQRDLRLRLTLGPMPHARFSRFLPGGPGERALREWLTLFTGVALEYEVRLCLAAHDVEPARLDPPASAQTNPTVGPRLGWSAFLITRPNTHDRSDAGYDIHALA